MNIIKVVAGAVVAAGLVIGAFYVAVAFLLHLPVI